MALHGKSDLIRMKDLNIALPQHRVLAQAARGVAYVARRSSLHFGQDGVYLRAQMDAPGKFMTEPRAVDASPGTAFLVTNRHVVTAGHLLAAANLLDTYFLFGFHHPEAITHPDGYGLAIRFARPQCWRASKLVLLRLHRQLGDIALVALPDAVPAMIARPLPLAPADIGAPAEILGALSHANAQALKAVVAPTGSTDVLSIKRRDHAYVYSNLDSFRGSSGSPLLDTFGRVIAVQVAGLPILRNRGNVPDAAADSIATRLDVIQDALREIGAPLPPANQGARRSDSIPAQ
jgi:Trypsin-like peptidase domain